MMEIFCGFSVLLKNVNKVRIFEINIAFLFLIVYNKMWTANLTKQSEE